MKKSFIYRLLVLFIAYSLFAVAILGSIATVVETWLFWTIFSVVIGLFVILVIGEEVVRFLKKKNG